MWIRLRERLHELYRAWADARHRSPVLVTSLALVFALAGAGSLSGILWFYEAAASALPDKQVISRMGGMDQSTSLYDDHDQLAFTIFKEQRIDAPLSDISQHLVRAALINTRRSRRSSALRVGTWRPTPPDRTPSHW